MPKVTFRIDGNARAAISELKTFKGLLDGIAANKGIAAISTNLKAMAPAVAKTNQLLTVQAQKYQMIRTAAKQTTRELAQHYGTQRKIQGVAARTALAYRKSSTEITQMTVKASRLAVIMQGISRGAAGFATSFARAGARAVGGVQASVGSGVGGIQSLGIGVRMSGIAMGNQLSQMFSGQLSGNILSGLLSGLKNAINTSAGLISIGAQMATRIVSGIAGTGVKMLGPLVGGWISFITSGLGGSLALAGKGMTQALGSVLYFAGGAIQSTLSGITQFAGETVIQVGNVFTGLTEVMRGAFQGAVNAVSSVLNSLLTIVQGIATKVGNAFGKIVGGVAAVGGTLGGLALRDRIKTDAAASSAALLFNPDVSDARRNRFRSSVSQIGFEFPTLPPAQIAKAAEMVVSTGFQHSPEDALEFLRGILPLAEMANLKEIPELARAAAKLKDLFSDEVAKAGGARGQGEYIAGRLFQVRNVGDLEIRDLANRLGEAAGVGKAFGLTLDDILKKLSLLSRGLNPEETFTAFRSLVARLQRPSKETREAFSKLHIDLKKITPEMREQLKLLEAQRDAALTAKDLVKGKGAPNERKRLASIASVASGQISDMMLRAESRDALDIVRDAANMRRAGQMSGEQFAQLFPNLRGLKGAATEAVLGRNVQEQIDASFSEDPKTTIRGASKRKRSSLSFAFSDVFKGMKEPFDTMLDVLEPKLIAFGQRVRAHLKGVTAWVKALWQDAGAAEFGGNLLAALAPLTGPITTALGKLFSMKPGEFWDAMNTGLAKTVEFSGHVLTFFKTLGGYIKGIVAPLASIGKGLGDIFKDIGGIFVDISGGDTASLSAVFKGIGDAFTGLIQDVKVGFTSLLSVLSEKIIESTQLALSAFDRFHGGMAQLVAGVLAFGSVGSLLRSRGIGAVAGAGGGGGGGSMAPLAAGMLVTGRTGGLPGMSGNGPSGVMSRPVVGRGDMSGMLGRTPPPTGGIGAKTMAGLWALDRVAHAGVDKLGGALRATVSGLSKFVAPFVAFDFAQQIMGGGSASRATTGGTALNIGTGALAGSAFGPWGAAAGAGIGAIASWMNYGAAGDEALYGQISAQQLQERRRGQSRIQAADARRLVSFNSSGGSEFSAPSAGARGEYQLAEQRLRGFNEIRAAGGDNFATSLAIDLLTNVMRELRMAMEKNTIAQEVGVTGGAGRVAASKATAAQRRQNDLAAFVEDERRLDQAKKRARQQRFAGIASSELSIAGAHIGIGASLASEVGISNLSSGPTYSGPTQVDPQGGGSDFYAANPHLAPPVSQAGMGTDSQGRRWVKVGGKRKYLTNFTGGGGFAGQGLTQDPSLGAFGIQRGGSKRRGTKAARFGGWTAAPSADDPREIIRRNATLISKAGSEGAAGGDKGKSAEAAKALLAAAKEAAKSGSEAMIAKAITTYLEAVKSANDQGLKTAEVTVEKLVEQGAITKEHGDRLKALEEIVNKSTAGSP